MVTPIHLPLGFSGTSWWGESGCEVMPEWVNGAILLVPLTEHHALDAARKSVPSKGAPCPAEKMIAGQSNTLCELFHATASREFQRADSIDDEEVLSRGRRCAQVVESRTRTPTPHSVELVARYAEKGSTFIYAADSIEGAMVQLLNMNKLARFDAAATSTDTRTLSSCDCKAPSIFEAQLMSEACGRETCVRAELAGVDLSLSCSSVNH